MGAETFLVRQKGNSAESAFQAAVENARYDHGHSGYTGTIAEKNSFRMVTLPFTPEDDLEGRTAISDFIDRQTNEQFSDKWGPAGCIDLGDEEYIFFGWASS